MNDLKVKDVEFCGATLRAAQDKDKVIWAGVRWLCDGMGLSENTIKNERLKIQKDLVLSQGKKFLPLGRDNANSDVLCLQLDYVPLWLAKISITPKMKKENPELVEKLIQYQLKAKDVLAAAFLCPYSETEVQARTINPSSEQMLTVVKEFLKYGEERAERLEHLFSSNMKLMQSMMETLDRVCCSPTQETPIAKAAIKKVKAKRKKIATKAQSNKNLLEAPKEKIKLDDLDFNDWRINVQVLARKICATDINYKDIRSVYDVIFGKMWSVYGYVQSEETKNYRKKYHISGVGTVDRLSVLYNSSLQNLNIFNSLLIDLTYNTCGDIFDFGITKENFRKIAKPLLPNYSEGASMGNYAKALGRIYERMQKEKGIDWEVEKAKHIKKHGHNTVWTKMDFIVSNPHLFNKFRETVREMCQEKDSQERLPLQN